ncbi:MAG: hypothetical protein EAZ53_11805 [Bacteroidetes bacterium]|nr:MAG: hypothetical protein EAZ53_11805 [Bacteroidota bacterium]
MIYKISDKGFKRISNSKKFIFFSVIFFPVFWWICLRDFINDANKDYISTIFICLITLLVLFFLFALNRKEYFTSISAIIKMNIEEEYIDFETLNTFKNNERIISII